MARMIDRMSGPVDNRPVPAADLAETKIIDFSHPDIQATLTQLQAESASSEDLVRNIFEHVRDEVRHSMDHGDEVVTFIASDVLREKTGLCYAKSHLAAALYRAAGIPAGLAYQLLPTATKPVLHGLVAINHRGHWQRPPRPAGSPHRPLTDTRWVSQPTTAGPPPAGDGQNPLAR